VATTQKTTSDTAAVTSRTQRVTKNAMARCRRVTGGFYVRRFYVRSTEL
jgi:hypothetical protein